MLFLSLSCGESFSLGEKELIRVEVEEIGPDAMHPERLACRLAVYLPTAPVVATRGEPCRPGRSLGSVAKLDAGQALRVCVVPERFWRRKGHMLLIGDDVTLLIQQVRGESVRIGIDAPGLKIGRVQPARAAAGRGLVHAVS